MSFEKISNTDLNRPNLESFKNQAKFPIIVVLEDIRSLLNVGSVFRTSDAFNIEAVYLCGITGTPPNKEIHKSALGSTESVEWKYYSNTIDTITELKEKDYIIYAVEQAKDAMMLNKLEFELTQKLVLIFGNEVEGVQQSTIDQCDGVIEIPQFGTKHSLNIAVSAGIVLWEFVRKR